MKIYTNEKSFDFGSVRFGTAQYCATNSKRPKYVKNQNEYARKE